MTNEPSNSKPSFPDSGTDAADLRQRLWSASLPVADWEAGRVFSFQYHPGALLDQTREAFQLFADANVKAPGLFPGIDGFCNEIAGMLEDLYTAQHRPEATLTSGGTESILLACRGARFAYRERGGESRPKMVVPVSAHPAFWKAAEVLDFEVVALPLDRYYRADTEALQHAMDERTAMVVGSAPSYPFGAIDPIPNMASLARRWNAWLHVDACIGGFLLPFLPESVPVPPYDFRLEGVSSISMDFHKYGFGGKTLSAILMAEPGMRRKLHFVRTDWPGGLYGSAAYSGSRSAGPVAAAWTALKSLGRAGYCELAAKSAEAAEIIRTGIRSIEDLHTIGEADLPVFAFGSTGPDIYRIGEEMAKAGWFLDRQQLPAALHLNVQPVHLPLAGQFVDDLREARDRASRIGTMRKVEERLERRLLRMLPSDRISGFIGFARERLGVRNDSGAAYVLRDVLDSRNLLDELIRDFLETPPEPVVDVQSNGQAAEFAPPGEEGASEASS